MTQPPSQQPPQGGFGAPQEPQGTPQPPPQPQSPPPAPPQMPPAPPQTPPPAQPGYGYPAPGAQPGQGYPQAPGQQAPGPYTQQPGPYGAPAGPYAQQPGPYGQQPGPYGQQPGYGYPQPQYPGAPVPGGSGGGPFKGKPAVIIGAALAALLVVGGGIFLLASGDDGEKKPVSKSSSDAVDPSTSPSVDQGDGKGDGREADDDLNAGRKAGEAKVLWLTKNDIDLPRNGAGVHGPWVVGDTLVKGMYRTVTGYSVADGKKKWDVPLPADICSAPGTPTADGKIVIGVKNGTTDRADCSDLQMIDLNTGKAGWKKSVKKNGTWDLMTDIGLAISGDTVTVGRTGNSSAYRVSDGKDLFGKPSGNCQPFAFAGGPKLIAAASCRTDDVDNPQHQIQEIDPATGKAKWTYQPKRGWEVQKVYSVSPLVVSLTQREEKKWGIIALKENGTLRSQLISDKGDNPAVDCGSDFGIFGEKLEGCTGVAADANTLYMMTADDTSGTSRTNKVLAFDLNTGKTKWKSAAPAERTMKPLRMEGGNVLVYLEPTYDKGGAVATIAATGGAPKVLLQHPASTSGIENFFSSRTVYVGGRSFVVSDRVTASNDEEEKEQTTMMAFGK